MTTRETDKPAPPLGLPNPRVQACCSSHPAGGRVCNYCYQNAVYQCLASLPWTRSMLDARADLPQRFWSLLEILVSGDVLRARKSVPKFIARYGVRIDAQFSEGGYENCHGQACLAQCDAGEFFVRFLDVLFRTDEARSPFNFTMDVQHFETRHYKDSKHVMAAKETHSLLIVEPVARDLNDCIAASYDESNVVSETTNPGSYLFLRKTVNVTKTKQANVILPGPKFLAVYIKRVRGVAPRSMFGLARSGVLPKGEKDERVVEIPLSRFTLEGKTSLAYHCTGIVCHVGHSINAGHYVAYVRRGAAWYYCDDDYVVEMDHTSFGARRVFQPLAST
jgi:ubiquitin C-terminal hydrolase